MGRYAIEPDNATKSAKAKVSFNPIGVSWLVGRPDRLLNVEQLFEIYVAGLQLEGSLQEHQGDSPSHQGDAPPQVVFLSRFKTIDCLACHHLCSVDVCLINMSSRATKYLKNVIAQKEIIPFRWTFNWIQ